MKCEKSRESQNGKIRQEKGNSFEPFFLDIEAADKNNRQPVEQLHSRCIFFILLVSVKIKLETLAETKIITKNQFQDIWQKTIKSQVKISLQKDFMSIKNTKIWTGTNSSIA